MNRIEDAYRRAGYTKPIDMSPEYYMGLDLGMMQDFTALAVIKATRYKLGRKLSNSNVELDLGHLERFELGTDYITIAKRIKELKSRLSNVELIVDATGVGGSVVQIFDAMGLEPIKVNFTAGSITNKGKLTNLFNVPKKDLVFSAVTALQNKRIRIASKLKEADALKKELQNFQVRISRKGNSSYQAAKHHDDLVAAICLALWRINYNDEKSGEVYLGKLSL